MYSVSSFSDYFNKYLIFCQHIKFKRRIDFKLLNYLKWIYYLIQRKLQTKKVSFFIINRIILKLFYRLDTSVA